MSRSVTKLEPVEPAQPTTTMGMVIAAVNSGADLDRIEKLMELHNRYEANEARKAFSAAMARFRAEPMKILKTKSVNIPGGAQFKHATLAAVVDGVIVALSKYGLRHAWQTKQENGQITVTCVISHELGHSESTTLFAPPDSSGKKNDIQQIASTVSYLERYTLMAATGLAASDMDTDGNDPKDKGGAEVERPKDTDTWMADARAVADEGSARLQDLWQKTPSDIRRYVVMHEAAWWADMKAKAAKVVVS